MDDSELRKTAERYAEHMARMASEAGLALDRAMAAMETGARQAYDDISRETKTHTDEMKRLAQEIMGDMKEDVPRLRDGLRDVEDRARRKLRELRGR